MSTLGGEQLYWKPPADKPTHRITLPVEVKKQWRDMISQAATYARCLFGANPMRTFALVLAFNHKSNMLRFLVFHPGGLTASEEYNITEHDGLKEIARLFLTLASWCTAEEAGFITCCNDDTCLLPANQEGTLYVSAAVEGILFRSVCIRGRMTFVSRLRLPTNAPPMVPESLRRKLPEPLIESGALGPFVRLLDEKSTPSDPIQRDPAQRAGSDGGRRSQSPTAVKFTTTPREKGQSARPELARSGSGPMTRSVWKNISAFPAVQEQTDGEFFSSRRSRNKLTIQ
jgi:hypothetical protein